MNVHNGFDWLFVDRGDIKFARMNKATTTTTTTTRRLHTRQNSLTLDALSLHTFFFGGGVGGEVGGGGDRPTDQPFGRLLNILLDYFLITFGRPSNITFGRLLDNFLTTFATLFDDFCITVRRRLHNFLTIA